ncbi:TIGR02677 family protein [Actinocorallia libanotica]|uniref:TIGR02677 family protein n=1 Tax=Actinocorallia libanotica TaxID=46162 RepID=A0ABP4BIG9_9ACTN
MEARGALDAGGRAGLDGSAIGDRFRLFNFTRRDDHLAYLRVLRAMDRLRSVHQVRVHTEQVAAALNELVIAHEGVLGEGAEGDRLDERGLRDKLDALAEDGVVHRLEDASRAGSLARYRNRQSVYQFSELGYRAYTAVEQVLAARVRDANLSRLVFSDVLDDLRALAVANRAGDRDQVYRRISRLDAAMEDMARRSAQFHVTLGEIIRSTDTSTEMFLTYKNALLTHMSDFMTELDRYLPRLAEAVQGVEETGVYTLLSRAADADERLFLHTSEKMEDWQRRWAALREWFSPQDSKASDLREATRTAVSAVIALLRQITEAQRGGVNRSTQLRHLAEWVFHTPDDESAHALMSAAFNLRSARHLGGAHDDDEQISTRATWWDAPGIELSISLFRTGRAPTPGLPQPVKVNRGIRAELRRSQFEQRAVDKQAAASLSRRGPHDRVLTEPETRVVLKLLTRALEARTVVAGRLTHGAGADDTVELRLIPSEAGSTVRTEAGTLHLPGFHLEIH